jgi:hypothetical protein
VRLPLPSDPPATATAAVRPDHALELTLRGELRGRGPVVVTFPAAVRLPACIPREAVLVNGHPPAAVTVTGHVVALTLPRSDGLACDVTAPAALTVVFTPAAGLGNPAAPGRYPIWLRQAGLSAVAHLVVP